MHRQQVDSSVIIAVGYDDGSAVLEVVFRTGRTYRYFRVPRAAHDALMHAESIGGYFNREIRPHYHGIEVK